MCRCAKQKCTSFISLAAYLRYQASSAAEPPPGSLMRKGSSPAREDREAAGLIARVDPGQLGDAVARHVVMVGRLAELLRREQRNLDGALGGSFHRLRPRLVAELGERMVGRHPVGELQLDLLVLGARRHGDEREQTPARCRSLPDSATVSSNFPPGVRFPVAEGSWWPFSLLAPTGGPDHPAVARQTDLCLVCPYRKQPDDQTVSLRNS